MFSKVLRLGKGLVFFVSKAVSTQPLSAEIAAVHRNVSLTFQVIPVLLSSHIQVYCNPTLIILGDRKENPTSAQQ